MNKRICLALGVSALCVTGIVGSQEMILNMVANKVIAKYQGATCEQLWQQKGQPEITGRAKGREFSAQRSEGPDRFPEQDCATDRQQDVRMRHDSLDDCRRLHLGP